MAGEIRIRLCKQSDERCPEVVMKFGKGVVYIGEGKNMVRLTKDQWNMLVEKVREGELTAV